MFDILASHTHEEEDMWPDGTHPMLFIGQVVFAYQVLGM